MSPYGVKGPGKYGAVKITGKCWWFRRDEYKGEASAGVGIALAAALGCWKGPRQQSGFIACSQGACRGLCCGHAETWIDNWRSSWFYPGCFAERHAPEWLQPCKVALLDAASSVLCGRVLDAASWQRGAAHGLPAACHGHVCNGRAKGWAQEQENDWPLQEGRILHKEHREPLLSRITGVLGGLLDFCLL